MSNKPKDRNLSPLAYLEALQLEYFKSKLMRDIHFKISNKRFHERVMGHKKDKILGIASNNGIDSIFSNTELWEEYRNRVFGLDNIHVALNSDELYLYYMKGQDVKVSTPNKTLTGQIENYSQDSSIVTVKIKGEFDPRPFSSKCVMRIF